MGTTYNIKIIKNSNNVNFNSIQFGIDSVLIEVNKLFSTYIPESEISKFNVSKKEFEISDEFKHLFLHSDEINKNTNGAFDPTIHPLVKLWGFGNKGKIDKLPDSDIINNILENIGFNEIELIQNKLIKSNPNIELDFSAIAKGYGVDVVSNFLVSNDIKNFMVEIGGEVFCKGNKFGQEWKIGLQNPFFSNNNESVLKIISLKNVAMATSGSYRNYFEFDGVQFSHTINPSTGYPIKHDAVSVSVIANDCATADAYATALMVLGVDKGIELINKNKSLEAVFIKGNEENFKLILSKNMGELFNDSLD